MISRVITTLKVNECREKELVLADFGHLFSIFLNFFLWVRITDEGTVPEMRIWSKL